MKKQPEQSINFPALFAFPLKGAVLGATIVLAVFMWFSSHAGILGIPLGILTVVATVQYAFVIARHSLLGHREPPALGITEFNPAHTLQPIFIAILLILGFDLAKTIYQHFGVIPVIVFLATFVMFLPAIMATMIAEQSVLRAINPVRWFHIIKTFETPYFIMVGMVFAVFTLSVLLSLLDLPSVLENMIAIYGFFLLSHTVGYLIFYYRDRLGMEVYNAPENKEAREARYRMEDHRKMMDLAYQTSRTDPDQAVVILKNYQAEHHFDVETSAWMFKRLQEWDNLSPALWFAQSLISRQLTSDLPQEAITTSLWCLGKNQNFRPQGPADTLSLGRIALANGQYKLGTLLLHDFAKRFPGNDKSLEALVMAGNTAAEKLNQPKLAKTIYDQLIELGLNADDERLQKLALSFTNSDPGRA